MNIMTHVETKRCPKCSKLMVVRMKGTIDYGKYATIWWCKCGHTIYHGYKYDSVYAREASESWEAINSSTPMRWFARQHHKDIEYGDGGREIQTDPEKCWAIHSQATGLADVIDPDYMVTEDVAKLWAASARLLDACREVRVLLRRAILSSDRRGPEHCRVMEEILSKAIAF